MLLSTTGGRQTLATLEGGEGLVYKEQSVSEMVAEVLGRQAKTLVERTGQSLGSALEVVSKTDAGRQLGELANGECRDQRAREWQVGMARERAQERRYWRLEGYTEWLEGKEARGEYYTLLEELASLRG
jgi:hypothetical protein